MHGKYEDLTGKKIGKLTIIKRGKNRNKRVTWECKCDCGNKKEVPSDCLKRGHTISCGCAKKGINRLKPGVNGFNKVKYAYKNSSKVRKIQFELNNNQLKRLFKGNCHFCKIEPKQNSHGITSYSQEYIDHANYVYNGIDRIDNNVGYIYENCVSCCMKCNSMKSEMSRNEFYEQITKIYEEFVKTKGN